MSSGSTLKRNGRYIHLSIELDREPAGDNQSAKITATGSSFSSTISVPVSSSQAEDCELTMFKRRFTRVIKRPDRINL